MTGPTAIRSVGATPRLRRLLAESLGETVRRQYVVNGVVVVVDTLVTTRRQWRASEESKSGEWSTTTLGRLVLAQRAFW